jgi:LysR family transcriptional regulator, regulator for metE and metH
LTEYLDADVVTACKLGPEGLWCTLYAAIREDQRDTPFMEDFLTTAVSSSFEYLSGIGRVD